MTQTSRNVKACERPLPPSFKGSLDLQEMLHFLQRPQNSHVILMILGGKVIARKMFYVIIKNSAGSPGPSLIFASTVIVCDVPDFN